MDDKDLMICKQEMKILNLELELKLQTEQAVLKEKTKRMEAFIYGGFGMIIMQLIGLFILWVKDIL